MHADCRGMTTCSYHKTLKVVLTSAFAGQHELENFVRAASCHALVVRDVVKRWKCTVMYASIPSADQH